MIPDSERNRASEKDDPRQAIESGEPEVEGRTRGHVVDKKSIEGTSDPKGKAGDNIDWESGRQQAL